MPAETGQGGRVAPLGIIISVALDKSLLVTLGTMPAKNAKSLYRRGPRFDLAVRLFVCLVLNDASTLVGH